MYYENKEREPFAKKIVENIWLTIAGRISMILCTIFLAIGGWAGTEVWSGYKQGQERVDFKLDQITDKINQRNTDYALLKQAQETLAKQTTYDLAAQSTRIDKLEVDVEALKRRVYSVPEHTVAQPTPVEQARKKWEQR